MGNKKVLSSKDANEPNEQSGQRCCEERKRKKQRKRGTRSGDISRREGGILGLGSAREAGTEVIQRFQSSHWLVPGARAALLPNWTGWETAEPEVDRGSGLYGNTGKREIMDVGRAAKGQNVVQFMQFDERNRLIPRSSPYSRCRVERSQGTLNGTSGADDREDGGRMEA